MHITVWVVEGTWPACIDATNTLTPADADITLLHVTGDDVPGAAHGAFAGLLGRGHPERDPGTHLEHLATKAAHDLLQTAAQRLHRRATPLSRHGRIEREVIAAAEGTDLLVFARDGDHNRLGPRSLSPASRFVVDHAPCPILLVWPEPAPGITSIPPPPHPTRTDRPPL